MPNITADPGNPISPALPGVPASPYDNRKFHFRSSLLFSTLLWGCPWWQHRVLTSSPGFPEGPSGPLWPVPPYTMKRVITKSWLKHKNNDALYRLRTLLVNKQCINTRIIFVRRLKQYNFGIYKGWICSTDGGNSAILVILMISCSKTGAHPQSIVVYLILK